MGKKRQLVLGAINVTLPPPHRPERYVSLFRRAYGERRAAKLQGDWVALIGGMAVEDDGEGGQLIRGEFYKYISLDVTRDWYNVAKGKPADAQDLELIKIPDELKPHFQVLSFVFFSRRHRLVLITKDGKDSLSVHQAAAVLAQIFGAAPVIAEFGRVDVVVEPSRETLESIFGMDRLRSLVIEVTPPNPDDFEEFEQELFDDMNNQRAGSYHFSMHESDSRGLAPGENAKRLAAVAQSNGKVTGTGGRRGKTKTLSTSDHPLLEKAAFDSDAVSRRDFLLDKARNVLRKLRRRNVD